MFSVMRRKKTVAMITASHVLLFTVIFREKCFCCLATTQNSQIMEINLEIGNKVISVLIKV